MALINVLDAAGTSTPVQAPLPPGQAARAASVPTVLSTEQEALILRMVTALEAASTPIPAGTNAIGTVSVSTSALPTGAATATRQDTGNTSLGNIDNKLPALVGGAVPTSAVPPAVLYAPISQNVTASTPVVAATTGKSIKVLGYLIVMSGGANTVAFQSGTTALSGAMAFGANGGVEASPSTLGHFVTAVGAALNMTLSAATLVSGHVVYQLV